MRVVRACSRSLRSWTSKWALPEPGGAKYVSPLQLSLPCPFVQALVVIHHELPRVGACLAFFRTTVKNNRVRKVKLQAADLGSTQLVLLLQLRCVRNRY